MADALKGLAGGWTFLSAWIFPSILAWSGFGLLVFPRADSLPLIGEVASTSAGNQALVLLGASILTGLLLSALSTVMYRVLEGYLLPEWMADRLRARQLKSRTALEAKLEQLRQRRRSTGAPKLGASDSGDTGIHVRIALVREQLRQFPADDRQLGPTRFSNALRAIETYGWDRYRLDSQTLWSELQGVLPEAIQGEDERSRAPINFFVSLVYLSGASGITFMVVGAANPGSRPTLLFAGLCALVLVPVWYRLAILNTRYLLAVVQATVNLGRAPLADALGLELPAKLEDERDMWERLFWSVQLPHDPRYIADLDRYRANGSRARAKIGGGGSRLTGDGSAGRKGLGRGSPA